jgi:hypothetical protein
VAEKKNPKGAGRKPVPIDPKDVAKFAEMQATYEEIASWYDCSERTVLNRLKQPKYRLAYEKGRLRGRLNFRRLQLRHAQGLDYNGKPTNSPGPAVNMTIHMSEQPYWLGESKKAAVEVNPIELVITRIEHVIVDSSSDQDRQGLPPLIEVQAIQGR